MGGLSVSKWTAIVMAAVAVFAAVACSEESDGPAPVAPAESTLGDLPLTEEAFRALMMIEDVSALLASGVSLEAQYRDFKEMASRAGASEVETVENWHGLTGISGDGSKALTFSVLDFDSVSSARSYYETMRTAIPGMQDMDPPIGESSAQVLIDDQGVGGSLIFIKRDKVIPLNTAQPEGEPPLLLLEDVERLAEQIASRL